MATQQDLQELLRLQTARKMPIKDAMGQIRALQAVSLRSIKQIADAPLPTVEAALDDQKAARALQNACKAHLRRAQTSPASAGAKRPAARLPAAADAAKRIKYSTANGLLVGPMDLTPEQLEASLAMPIDTNQDRIARAAVYTNRAPLVLAFAVELVRQTMPEQPPSSRLSLGQAVVSANSRTKAVNIGLEKGRSADQEGWGEGQPRIRVMGREIAVLKRGGYEWKGEEVEVREDASRKQDLETDPTVASSKAVLPESTTAWATSPSVSLKQSTFVARATAITQPSQRSQLINALFDAQPSLGTATHNVWAYRIRAAESAISNHPREMSNDDGETGAGDLLLRIMRETNTMDTLVVMTRWYGEIMLGPDRWRLMRNVVNAALSERLRRTGLDVSLGGEAVWGLDLESMRDKTKAAAAAGGMVVHRPEAARSYLLRSFPSPPAGGGQDGSATTSSARTSKQQEAEKEENLGLLLGALRLLFDSWADFLTPDELDRRAWGWYTAVRPDIDSGPAGWGAKGVLRLQRILDLRRKAS